MNSRPSLKPSSYLILGLVRNGYSSGYAIKRIIEDARMNNYWATTFAQIYPELAQLEADGYMVRRDDPHGGRARSAYSLTEQGEHALDAWLRSPELPPMEVRDEGLLRMVFADDLTLPEAVTLVRQLRRRSEEALGVFRDYDIPMAERFADEGKHFALVLARMGTAYHTWAVEWFTQLEAELQARIEQLTSARAAQASDGGPPTR
jgi:DNA-binding PadR family transcriptional regulator